MTTTVPVPESLRSYFTDPAIRSVVDHMLDAKASELPTDLDWDEISDFHRAHASAAKVRADYAVLLLELWDAVWKAPLKDNEITEDVPFSKYPDDTLPSPKVVWDDCLYRIFEVGKDVRLQAGLGIPNAGHLVAYFKPEQSGRPYPELVLPASWSVDEDNYYCTPEEIAIFDKDQSSIDVTELQQMVRAAVAALR